MSRLVFRLAVVCEGDAFKPAAVPESVSILRTLAERIEAGHLTHEAKPVRDITGQIVGSVQCMPETE